MSYYPSVQVAVTEDGTKQIMGEDIHYVFWCLFVFYLKLSTKFLLNLLPAITELTSLNLGMATLLNAPLHASEHAKVCLKLLCITAFLFLFAIFLLLNFFVILTSLILLVFQGKS